ncbi:MAG: alpha/beta fold hydrolase [Burkholderiales bacterium]|nr:alpha/beta fold hydrolase [Burkholderiales bacterium]
MGRIVAASATLPRRGRWGRTAAVVAGLALGLSGCAWLDVEQRELALRPTPGRPAAFAPGAPAWQTAFHPGDQRWTVPVPGAGAGRDRLALWWLPAPDPQAPTLLYLHGTFRNLYQNLPKIDALRRAGFAIVAVDYRGWGDSAPIVPSEATITADAAVAWAELERRQPVPLKRVIYGHSMGSAVAVRLASGLHYGADYGALVLESSFTSLPDVAAAAGFWGRVAAGLTTLNFDAVDRISQVDAPVLMLHGDADRTVPVALGRRLRDAARPGVRWVEVPGGTHSDLQTEAPALYQHTFHQLIRRLDAAAASAATAASAPATTR